MCVHRRTQEYSMQSFFKVCLCVRGAHVLICSAVFLKKNIDYSINIIFKNIIHYIYTKCVKVLQNCMCICMRVCLWRPNSKF